MLDRLDDTIVAISSPAGTATRGIVRLSGPRAIELAAAVFTPSEPVVLSDMPGHRRSIGQARIGEAAWLPAEAYVFRAPRSYTRQDLVELHLAGAPPVLAIVLESLVAAGARLAEPGEFTARAFFAGAMDLTEVEGVAALIAARNDSQLRAAEALMHGDLSRRVAEHRERLADLLALVEARIDFAEESETFISLPRIAETLADLAGPLEHLCRTAPAVERLDELPTLLIAGAPNAGKSSLFNRLTGMDRAIRSATAGTTRDLLSAPLQVAGGEVMLVDSAGLGRLQGEEPRPPGADPGRLARAHARQALARADAVLFVVDVTAPFGPGDDQLIRELSARPLGVVANKIDLLSPAERSAWLRSRRFERQPVPVSALTGEGVEDLQSVIDQLVFCGAPSTGHAALALSHRQRESLREACEALRRARELCGQARSDEEPAELLAVEIRAAIEALSLLAGEIRPDVLLERIFSRFCIGK